MKQTTNYNLNLLEHSDRMSLAPLNENAETLDALLKERADNLDEYKETTAEELAKYKESVAAEFGIRAKRASGTWTGSTACSSPGSYTVYTNSYGSTTKPVSGALGSPASSANDITITLDFEPKQVLITGYLEADINWSGYRSCEGVVVSTVYSKYQDYEAFTHSGKEYLSYQQIIGKGQRTWQAEILTRLSVLDTSTSTGTSYTGESLILETKTPGWSRSARTELVLVEFGTTDDGKYTVTIKGASSVYGTENYADIEGMTYNWVAFG